MKEILLASQINFILHYNDKIICQRNKIPVSSHITFQCTYANLSTHFHRVPFPAKFFFFQIHCIQWDVKRSSSGDQVARVTHYNYFFTKCSRIVKYHHRRQEHHSKSLFYAKRKVGYEGNFESGNQVYSRRE